MAGEVIKEKSRLMDFFGTLHRLETGETIEEIRASDEAEYKQNYEMALELARQSNPRYKTLAEECGIKKADLEKLTKIYNGVFS